MSREKRFNVRPKLDCFYFPPQEVDSQLEKKSTLDNKPQELSNNSVIKMLDVLKLSSYDHKLINTSNAVVPVVARSVNDVKLDGKLDFHESLKGDSIDVMGVRSGFKMLGLTAKDSLNDDTTDSDSAYSQSSDFSRESDIHSLNTTSSESDYLFIYHQIVKSESRYSQPKYNTITMHTPSGFTIDIDVEVTKTVVMLMKIILWLRQRQPYRANFSRLSPKLPDFLLKNQMVPNWDGRNLLPQEARQPKSPRRISFSPSTLLVSAVSEKSFQEARTILESDCDIDVNIQTPNGQSLIHLAAGNADLKCVKLLLEYGANPNIKDAQGWGPLHAAIRRGKWKCAILLIEAGANFAEYSAKRIQEYKDVLKMSRTYYKSMEIFV